LPLLSPAAPTAAPLLLQLHRVVVTRQSPDALLGLPGVLCVIGSSREKGHEKADIPIHVFGPEGTCDFLATMYDVSDWATV
jgi:ribonuclease BN (tRNA processing enzyme)